MVARWSRPRDPGSRHFRALKRTQRDIDLRPELHTHYYPNEFPEQSHACMDTGAEALGERLAG